MRVNAIDVGMVRTEQTDRPLRRGRKVWPRIEETIPLGRMATPADVGNVAAFLASDLASYVSGATLECTEGESPRPFCAGEGAAVTGLLEGRVAIVTGAGRGIGRAHALELARHGARVVVNDVDPRPEGRPRWSSEIESAGGRGGREHCGRRGLRRGRRRWCSRRSRASAALDVLVNNAGFVRDRMLVNATEDEWDAVIRVHLKGHFAPLRHAAAYWRAESKAGRQRAARVVNTSSGAGLQGSIGQATYSAAKAGIASLTLVAAAELGRVRRDGQRDRAGRPHPDDRGRRSTLTCPTPRTTRRWWHGWRRGVGARDRTGVRDRGRGADARGRLAARPARDAGAAGSRPSWAPSSTSWSPRPRAPNPSTAPEATRTELCPGNDRALLARPVSRGVRAPGQRLQRRSMMVPEAWAPPAHIAISAVEASRRSSSCSAVVRSRAPVAPTGWPSAMAPPLTLILSGGHVVHGRPRHHHAGERLVDLAQVEVADRHPGVVEQPGGGLHRPVEVVVRIGADQAGRDDAGAGREVERRARSLSMIRTAAAPSVTCDDVPAVWVPPSSTGASPASASSEVSRMPWSFVDALHLERLAVEPARVAGRRRAFCWDHSPNASTSARLKPRSATIRSAALELVGQVDVPVVGPRVAQPLRHVGAERNPRHRLHAAGDARRGSSRPPPSRAPGGRPAARRSTGRRSRSRRCRCGSPACIQARRTMLLDCSPAWVTQPPTTWSISGGLDARASQQLGLGQAEQDGRVDPGQPAVALAERGADGLDDHGSCP